MKKCSHMNYADQCRICLRADNDRLRGLLREWRQVADIAQDLTFVPIARKTDAALAGAAVQPSPQNAGQEDGK